MAWCGPNSTGIVLFLTAAAKLGVIAVPVNYRFTDDEAAYVTRHSDSVAVFTDTELAAMFHRIRAATPDVRTVFVHDGPGPDDADPDWAVDADAATAAAAGDRSARTRSVRLPARR